MSLAAMVRGQRNNNPLNIRRGSVAWYGEKPAAECADPEFCEFSELMWGVRAALKLLRKYITVYGCDSLQSIVYRWAPPVENNSKIYLQYVVSRTSIPASRVIAFDDMDRLIAIVRAMAAFESGIVLDYDICRDAWSRL